MLRTYLLLVAALAAPVLGDLPINCLYSDAEGTWVVTETERTGEQSIDCSTLGAVAHNKQFTLTFPDIVTDELGNTGTWTMLYNQGFEVRINERSYWANFDYNMTTRSFNCAKLFNGWSRDETVRNWACFTAVKAGYENEPDRHFVAPSPSNDYYVNDHAKIRTINRLQSSWTAKAYPEHEKYTVREMLQRGGGHFHKLPPTAPASKELKSRAAMLPTNFDWRNVSGVNYVSPVRDQASCGSCYAFASAGLIESRLRISTRNGRQDVFSTQDVVSCSNLCEGCAGGFPLLIAGRYGQDLGFVDESCNEYDATDSACDTVQTCQRTYVSEYEYVGGYYGACNEEAMMIELVENGPITVDMNVYGDFYNYDGGIYHHVEQAKSDFNPLYVVNHAILAVGYGVEESSGEKFWIVKNSWGASWGEDGYFRIRRGTNEVGIESGAVQATVIP